MDFPTRLPRSSSLPWRLRLAWILAAAAPLGFSLSAQEAEKVPAEIRPWLAGPQNWERDTAGPIVELGAPGAFDDRHIFAPSVARGFEGFPLGLWYSGSRGSVRDRVFRLGLATSDDGGRSFTGWESNPVFEFGDPEGRKSVLTPCLLREASGLAQKPDGRYLLYFSATDFHDPEGRHTLHRSESDDGIRWSAPSPPLLEGCYAPSLLKIGDLWQLWYTDVSAEPWVIRKAESRDGLRWRSHPEPVVVLDQDWEKTNLFYPHVIKPGPGAPYLMWYGSYLATDQQRTALGFAASLDGIRWYKHSGNPVLRPDPSRPWESHYVTSHSVAAVDGDLRIWYASREAPPFLHKYFALNTAVWRRPEPLVAPASRSAPDREEIRSRLHDILGIPERRVPLDGEKRGEIVHDGIVIEKWVFSAEPGSRVPALLYRPREPSAERLPAVVLTYGHGGSKSAWQYHYAGQLYARLGMACLAIDPIGEEERHLSGKMGTRAHDPHAVHSRADAAGRLIMGKMVFDTMRGIDFLEEREDIDPARIGVAGNSLGGAVAGWMAALEPRLRTAVVCGWAFDDIGLRTKFCTAVPNRRMREICTWREYLSLPGSVPVLVMNGDADVVIDREGDGSAWRNQDRVAGEVRTWYEAGGGHRPYFAHPRAIRWFHEVLGIPGLSGDQVEHLATINGGDYCDAHGIALEKLYGSDLHQRGATLASPRPPIRPLRREQLAVLEPGEIGNPEFTIEGWLEAIE